jgi:hypothetical protein
MGKKDKHAKAAKGGKKETKALKAREAELEAKIAEKGKAKVKAPKSKPADETKATADYDALSKEQRKAYHHNAAPGETVTEWLARVEGDESVVSADPTDEAAKRVAAKRALRFAGVPFEGDADRKTLEASVDRDNDELVAAYNLIIGTKTGHLLTSNVERAARDAELKADRPTPEEAPTRPRKAKPDELVVEVETEHGREFVAGPAADTEDDEELVAEGGVTVDEEFAKPSQATPELEEGRNGYKIMVLKADGTPDPKTVRQYTRVTTYIDNLEDKTMLEKWKLRTLLEGVAVTETDPDNAGIVAAIADLIHVRDLALAKARKADRKGKLEEGELADLEQAATKAFKDAADRIAYDALETGGVHAKANRGTDLHALCDLYDTEGMGAVNALLKAETITKSDHADVVAYAEAMIAAGVKVLESEVVVVHDGLKRAGRLDRIVLAKLPGMTRAVRMVADIKTGRVDYSVGKIAQQLEAYATSSGYDLATGERRDLKLSKTAALLIHLPAGKAKASIYPVDLKLGAKGNKLSAEVRAWRNEGKAAIDFGSDLAAPLEVIELEVTPGDVAP